MSSPSPRLLRVASLNLMNSPARLEERYALLAQELEGLDADVLCLQEVLREEQESVQGLLRQAGFVTGHFGRVSVSDVVVGAGGSAEYGNAVFTRFGEDMVVFSEITSDVAHGRLRLPSPRFGLSSTVVASVSLGDAGGEVHVLSSHFAWGQAAEATRLVQASVVDEWAQGIMQQDPAAVVVLGGDLNCIPESLTVQYLYGQQLNLELGSTHWVDAWREWGTPENEFTSVPAENSWSHATAVTAASALQGTAHVRPELVPARRIDYLLSYGWVYGRRGGPVSFRFWAERKYGGLEISDHAGIVADFAL